MSQIVKFKFSKNFEAMRSRIRRLPKLVRDAMDAQVKKDVINTIKEFQHGIRRNNFDLEQLKPGTIEAKRRENLPKPTTPLYGEGDGEKNSLINTLSFRKIKNGYRLYRRKAKHYKADLPLDILLTIHEYGAIIKLSPTHFIRIPPRPVVDKAIVRMLKKKKKGEPTRKVNKAINQLILQGKDNEFKKLNSEAGRMKIEA